MIQRIQSIFLALVALFMGASAFLPLWVKFAPDADDKALLTAFHLTHQKGNEIVSETSSIVLLVLAGGAALLALATIFMYKNRMRQVAMSMANTFVIGAFLGLSYYYSGKGSELFLPEQNGAYAIGFFAPVLAMVFNSLAGRFIRKDEKMVRDADRLR